MKAAINEWDLEQAKMQPRLGPGQSSFHGRGAPAHQSGWSRSGNETAGGQPLASVLTRPMAVKGARLY